MMARSEYIYVILAGARRDSIMGTYTVKHEMRKDFIRLWMDRQDLMVKRFRDGHPGHGAIMVTQDILDGKRSPGTFGSS